MAKALKTAALVVGGVALAFTGVGAAIGLAAGATSIAGAIGAVTSFGIGVSASTLFLVSAGLSVAAGVLQGSPRIPSSQQDRLTASINPRAPRATVYGQTAMATDVRYEEWSGADQDNCDWIIALASHRIDGVEEVWLNTDLAWSATTGVTAKYAGYFSVPNIVLEGSPANAFSFASGKWNGRLTGCAYLRLRFKVTGNGKKATSPFSSGVPTRITIIGRGMRLYDPRRDSTVPGGNGPMRADDQSTWRYTADDGAVIGENLALHALADTLGWRIRNPSTGEMKLAVGSGVPARRLNLASWIEAANLADEAVNRSAGGTEPRYHGAVVLSEAMAPKERLDTICVACNGRFRDTGGKLSFAISHNDLATAALDDGLLDDDVVGPFTWNPDAALDAVPNVVRGKYVDATTASLYQMLDYPDVRLPSLDGQDREFTLELAAVESPSQAQRIAKQVLQRKQYQREFTAPFDIRAWKYGVGDVVPFTFAPLSFDRKLFRVKEQEIGQGGVCNMTLTVESPAIYAWDRDDVAPVQPAEANAYDASKNPLILAIGEAAATANWSAVADDNGNRPEDGATVGAPPGTSVGGRPVEEVIAQLDQIEPIVLDLDLTKAAQDALRAGQRQADSARATIEATLLRLISENDRTRTVMRKVGIVEDEAAGTVRLYALDQVADRTSKVELNLLAQDARIEQRATVNYVNEKILQAQLPEGAQDALDELIARVSTAETEIDGLNAAIALRATLEELNTLSASLTSAEQRIDAAEGEITTKVERTDFDQLATRVGSSELTLLALGDVSSFAVTIRQARGAANDATVSSLRALLGGDEAARRQMTQVAQYRQEAFAKISDNASAIAQVSTLLTAQIGGLSASFAEEITARVAADQAQARATSQLSAQINDPTSGLPAAHGRITTVAQTAASENAATAQLVQQVSAKLGNLGEATVQDLIEAVVEETGRIMATRTVAIDINGNLVGTQLVGSEAGPGSLNLINADLRLGTGRVVFNNGTYMMVQGTGFGVGNEFISWFGPTMAITQCSRANAINFEAVNGDAYFGGSLSAGTFRNTSASSSLAPDASIVVGPFQSNGKPRSIVISLDYMGNRKITTACPSPAPSAPVITIEIYRGANASGVLLATQTLTGRYECSPGSGEFEPGYQNDSINASFTLTDALSGSNFTYFARIKTRSINVEPVRQILAVISTEQ